MSLAQIQDLLGSIYTDHRVRGRFAVDWSSVAHDFGLSPEEANQCRLLSAEQVSFFARSLIRKRLGRVRTLLPRTSNALGPEIDQLFDEYRAGLNGPPPESSLIEARAFVAFLASRFSASRLADTVKLDRAELAMHDPGRRIVVETFRAPLKAIVNNSGGPVIGRHTLVVWFRLAHGSHANRLSMPLPW
jgi:hypothetical protein